MSEISYYTLASLKIEIQQLIKLLEDTTELKEKYNEVLKLAKENADSNEYCLQELEKENKQLRKRLKMADKQMAKEEDKYFKMQEKIEQLNVLKNVYLSCYKAKHNDIKGEIFKLREENNDLKHTLEEIKKMCESHIEAKKIVMADEIINIINEVLK